MNGITNLKHHQWLNSLHALYDECDGELKIEQLMRLLKLAQAGEAQLREEIFDRQRVPSLDPKALEDRLLIRTQSTKLYLISNAILNANDSAVKVYSDESFFISDVSSGSYPKDKLVTKPSEKLDGISALLLGGDWFIDLLPKMTTMLKYAPEPIAHWIVDATLTPLMIESLKPLGVAPESVISLNEQPIIACQSLLCSSMSVNQLDENVTMLRTLIMGHRDLFPPPATRRLFLGASEDDPNWKVCSTHRFEMINPCHTPLEQLVKALAEAQLIVVSDGKAIGALIFANRKASLIEIADQRINASASTAAIAKFLGLGYDYLRAALLAPFLAKRFSPKIAALKNGEYVALYDEITVQQKPLALTFLASFVIRHDIEAVVEIGTGNGGLAKMLIDHTPVKVLTIDIEDKAGFLNTYSPRITRLVDDCFSGAAQEAVKRFIAGRKVLFLVDGGDKPREFNLFKGFLSAGSFLMAHDFAPTSDDFNYLKSNNIWCWHECSEELIDIDGFERLEDFESIWKNYVWGAYLCVKSASTDELSEER